MRVSENSLYMKFLDGKRDARVIKSMIDLTNNCAFKSEMLKSDITQPVPEKQPLESCLRVADQKLRHLPANQMCGGTMKEATYLKTTTGMKNLTLYFHSIVSLC